MELNFNDMFSSSPGHPSPLLDDDKRIDVMSMEEETIDPTTSKVGLDDFELLKLIGKGAFGKVYQVRQKKTDIIYATKILRKSYLIKTKNVEYTRTERDILRAVRHPFIVSLHYAFQTESKLYLVMDYMNGGQLFDHLHKEGMFDENLARHYTAQMVLALEHLHQLSVIHRDLKPENILLDGEGNICITDFGLAYQMKEEGERTKTYCGTLDYMSPEMLQGLHYDQSTDWWSLGVLLYEMLTGEPAFKGKDEGQVKRDILNKKIKLPSYLSREACAMLKGLMERDPAKRFGSGTDGVRKLKNNPFFKGINWRKLLNLEVTSPFKPKITKGMLDTDNFDPFFTKQKPVDSPANSLPDVDSQDLFRGFTYIRSPSIWGTSD